MEFFVYLRSKFQIMLDREYLNLIEGDNEFEGIDNFKDEDVLNEIPVSEDNFNHGISQYIDKLNTKRNKKIESNKLYCFCAYFYHYTMTNLVYVFKDEYLKMNLWLEKNNVNEIHLSSIESCGQNPPFTITDKKVIEFIINKIRITGAQWVGVTEAHRGSGEIIQVKASDFHDDIFEEYYFFHLLQVTIKKIHGKINADHRRLIIAILTLFGIHKEQSSGDIDLLRRKSYGNIELRAKKFWESYHSATKKTKYAYMKKHGYFVKPNTKESPHMIKERELLYYILKYNI